MRQPQPTRPAATRLKAKSGRRLPNLADKPAAIAHSDAPAATGAAAGGKHAEGVKQEEIGKRIRKNDSAHSAHFAHVLRIFYLVTIGVLR